MLILAHWETILEIGGHKRPKSIEQSTFLRKLGIEASCSTFLVYRKVNWLE